jgi:hypothetical protein
MGLNDDQLSTAEHDDMRSRLLAGAGKIKPAGAHRRAIITTTVAVVLVAGLSAGAIGAANFLRMDDASEPVATPTETGVPSATPTPTETFPSEPTPTPSESVEPVPREAIRPFGGDCAAALDVAVVRDALGAEPHLQSADGDFHLFTSTGAAALAGGTTCSWSISEDGVGPVVGISVFPASIVTAEVLSTWSELRSEGLGYYMEKQRRFGDLVIGATATPLNLTYGEPTEEELAAVDQRVENLIVEVARNAEGERAEPARGDDSWWRLGTCADLSGVLESEIATPMSVGFPGDSIPLGMVWDTLVEAKAVDWCSWYSNDIGGSLIVEIYTVPGAGRPTDAELAEASATPADVVGADESWIVEDVQRAGDFSVLAVSGPNRLTMRFAGAGTADAAEELAAAFLAELG